MGIYHVMLRGINRQDVFLEKSDFELMVRCLRDVQVERDDDGEVIMQNGMIYAYCILHNHVHILLREGEQDVSQLMKRLQNRFVAIYNYKYDRVGHMFQDRFASEPVNDMEYFHRLLRYIHRNPVKALEAVRPEDYIYSSWREYLMHAQVLSLQKSAQNANKEDVLITGSDPVIRTWPVMPPICHVLPVIERFGIEDLVEWVNMDVDDSCMDIASERTVWREEEAWEELQAISQVETPEYFKQLRHDHQLAYLKRLIEEKGVSLRQASRLSSLSYKAIWNYMHPQEYAEQQKAKMEMLKRKRRLKGS